MATVKKRGQFRQHEPYATRDVNWYMDWKIDGYIQYLDEIDPVGIYTLEYDTDIPTKEELLNGIDQNHIQRYSTQPKAVDKEEEKDNTNWFFESEIVLHDEEEPMEEIKETIKSGSVIEQLVLNAKLNKKRKQELRAKRRQEEKEARERRLEREKANEEIENLKQEKEKYKKLDREYIKKYYKEFGMEGLNTLYQDSVFKISQLRLMINASDVIVEADLELQEAYQYRQEYVNKLIEHERQKLNKE
jgi:hypothetical protein